MQAFFGNKISDLSCPKESFSFVEKMRDEVARFENAYFIEEEIDAVFLQKMRMNIIGMVPDFRENSNMMLDDDFYTLSAQPDFPFVRKLDENMVKSVGVSLEERVKHSPKKQVKTPILKNHIMNKPIMKNGNLRIRNGNPMKKYGFGIISDAPCCGGMGCARCS